VHSCEHTGRPERDNVVYWKTNGKINNDLQETSRIVLYLEMNQESSGIALVWACMYEGCRRPRARLWARAPVSTLVVPIGRRVVTAALGRQLRRRAKQQVRCSWTLRIAGQLWLAGGAAVGVAGEGQAEGQHSSTFWSASLYRLDIFV